MFPKQFEAEGARQGNTAVRKDVDDEKGVDPGYGWQLSAQQSALARLGMWAGQFSFISQAFRGMH
jgi:hypothetical protein